MYGIRNCKHEDLPEVVRLSQTWAEECITKGYENVKWTEEKLASRLGDYFLVGLLENTIVGYTFGTIKTSGGS